MQGALASALSDFRDGLADLFSNMNDCHDESGKFCEGGGSSGAGSKDKSPRRTGIGPQGSIHTAEKRGKEYGYAKKVSFYQCTSLDQANEISAQLAELSDETGLSLERVYVYKGGGKSKEAPSNSNGYQQGQTLGFRDGVTAAYVAGTAYREGERESDIASMRAKVETYRRIGGMGNIVRAYEGQIAEAEDTLEFKSYTFVGNGVRNPVVDHEFAHSLVDRAFVSEVPNYQYYKPETPSYHLSSTRGAKIDALGAKCRALCEARKFSIYGARGGTNALFIKNNEPIAETYAYWKAGNEVPPDIEAGLRRLEGFRRAPLK